jgi:hypothetical protein
VLTYHNDLARDGGNLTETILTPANVNSTNFGKLFSYSVDGQVYAEPLYKSSVVIPGQGTHDVVFVATEHDSVYAFDAVTNTTGPGHDGLLWKDSFINPSAGINTVLSTDVNCGQIAPEIGITGTPVIDPSTGTMYLVAMTKQGSGAATTYHQTLYALDITTGAVINSVEVAASVSGTASGDTFNPKNYKERTGLVLLNGVVYTAWASHCDITPAHGWVIGYDASTLVQTSVFNTSPNGQLDTIWGGSGSLAVDAGGNIYFETGNGSGGGPSNGNYPEAFLKLSTSRDLSVADYFIPANYQQLDATDRDIGSGAPIVLPDQPGDHTHLLVGAGKDGRIFLIDRDMMGGLNNPPDGPDQIVQELPDNTIAGGSWDTPAYFDSGSDGNRWIYYAGSGDHLKAFSLTNGLLSTSPTSQSSATFPGSYGATPIVSANGTSNGIVWAVAQGGTAVLRAYDAINLTTELYDSNQAGTRDQLGASVKFATPTVADGKVFVGTSNSLTIFGEFPPVVSAIPDQTVPATQQTLNVTVTATDPHGLPLTYSATGQSLAYLLTQLTGPLYYYNSGLDGWGGRDEKWLFSSSSQGYFILPTGELYQWDGSGSATGTLLGNVGASYYTDPTQLTSPPANELHATLSFAGNVLAINRDPAWVSNMVITVTVSDGLVSTYRMFNVSVTTQPPVLAPIADQTIPSSQQVVTITMSATDPGGLPITYSATGHSLAFVLTENTGTLTYHSERDNSGGRGEKWLLSASSQWYFILANGALYQSDGSSAANGTLLGNVGASYYGDPTLLTNPPANEPHATLSFDGNTLTITPDTAWISSMVITVTASDGLATDNKLFNVFVTA